MKKEGMFMGRTQETAEDGMFMKFAGVQVGNPKGQKALKPVAPVKGVVSPKPQKALGAPGVVKMSSLAERIGHPAIGRPGVKVAELSADRVKHDAQNFSDKAIRGGKALYSKGSKGIKDLAGKSLDWFEHLSPQQAALIAGGTGLYGVHKTVKGVRGLVSAAKTGKAIRAARAARAANPGILRRLAMSAARRGR